MKNKKNYNSALENLKQEDILYKDIEVYVYICFLLLDSDVPLFKVFFLN